MKVQWRVIVKVKSVDGFKRQLCGEAKRLPRRRLDDVTLNYVVTLLGLVMMSLASVGGAQTLPPATAASAPATGAAPSESLQRQADSVFRWIKIHSDKPRKPVAKSQVPASAAAGVAATASAPQESTLQVAAIAQPPEPAVEPVALAVAPVVAAAPEVPLQIDVDVPLKPIAQPKPEFPEDVMTKLGKGGVKLRFVVQPDGTVSAPEVLSSSHRRLNPPALAAIASWRFEPIPAPRTAQVELGFDLD